MESAKPILVVGATGLLGTEICRQLIAAKKKVKGLVRQTSDPAKVKALQDLGVETVVGDMKDLASLDRAFQGAGAVVSSASSTISRQEGDSIETVDRQGQLNVVDAADRAWVDKFVFVSFLEIPESFPLQDAKREVENRLVESNMNYTILRPSYFMEVWLGPHLGFDPANHKATIYGPGVNKVSWIAVKDVAAFAVASLEHTAAINSILDIGGPQALSPLETVRIFEEQTGHPFELQYVPQEALEAQKEASTDPLQQSFSALMLALATGSAVDMERTLELFPLKLTSVLDYSHHFLGQGMVEA